MHVPSVTFANRNHALLYNLPKRILGSWHEKEWASHLRETNTRVDIDHSLQLDPCIKMRIKRAVDEY